jgi:hypothetical protein
LNKFESPFWAAKRSKDRKLRRGIEGKIRNDNDDLLDSRGWDMASKAGLDVVRCDVNVDKARLALARLPTSKYGRTEREAYMAARCGLSVVYQE